MQYAQYTMLHGTLSVSARLYALRCTGKYEASFSSKARCFLKLSPILQIAVQKIEILQRVKKSSFILRVCGRHSILSVPPPSPLKKNLSSMAVTMGNVSSMPQPSFFQRPTRSQFAVREGGGGLWLKDLHSPAISWAHWEPICGNYQSGAYNLVIP